jgi:RNA polymerase sigma-70 factor (ECF subfamily)
MTVSAEDATGRETLDRMLADIRPKLHRYCARMTGSVIDGEDVLQDALIKALEAFSSTSPIANAEGWLFRIAHNTALDFLRRRARLQAIRSDEDPDMIADASMVMDNREIAATSLRTFMRLPATQRSSVILMDVLGYSLDEIGDIMGSTVPAVKAALHRGRAQLREFALEPEDAAPATIHEHERALLANYIDRFNARDLDSLRAMLATDVRLDLVARKPMAGPEVVRYFGNYEKVHDWHFMPGLVDGRAAALVCNPDAPSARPDYFVLLDWSGGRISHIRDFRYARYAMDDAVISAL